MPPRRSLTFTQRSNRQRLVVQCVATCYVRPHASTRCSPSNARTHPPFIRAVTKEEIQAPFNFITPSTEDFDLRRRIAYDYDFNSPRFLIHFPLFFQVLSYSFPRSSTCSRSSVRAPIKALSPHEKNRPSISIIRASPATPPFSISFQSPHVSTFISVLYKTLLADASVLTRTRLPFCAPRSLATAYKEKPRTERVCSSITRCADQSDLWVLLKLCCCFFYLHIYVYI